MTITPEGADHAAFTRPAPRAGAKAWLVGGGIASMAAAAFMIRDGDILGADITILEETDVIGGSLDGSGTPETGYVVRGGRMLESKYLCTFDLFSSIPALDGARTVTEEIFDWNRTMQTSSRSRFFVDGERRTAPAFDLTEKHILTIERLALLPEVTLGNATIAGQFDPSFFETNFWIMWCTTFAFQPWHSAVEFKRYLVRFAHMIGGFNRLTGIMRTVYNQYDSLVRPLHKWLADHGVRFETGVRVVDIDFVPEGGGEAASSIIVEKAGVRDCIELGEDDFLLVTLGSMTEASSLGAMDAAPALKGKSDGGAWRLWRRIAAGRRDFGRPATFAGNIDRSKWVSFTTTLTDPTFLNLVRDATGNVPGEGGLITFPQSSWLASIVIPHQPHFIGQPDSVSVFWGYGLSVDAIGDFVQKPMSACTGREIMTEILGHLGIVRDADTVLAASNCIPCMMPFITSQFMPRKPGDRPRVVPQHSVNYAFIGQYCELPDDVVFTVEYSVRSAQAAVSELLGLARTPPPVYKGMFDPRVLIDAFVALHDLGDRPPEQDAA
ncbi:oleate hydratase [Sphingomonas montana]|uniref:oleate hydratase n=1 Tax=Sphingomonas montana TaxID=1843236 RepID=UPI00096E8240|nr:oleate hydratase [Sphingomonas montana]